jgi:hypothetical protein
MVKGEKLFVTGQDHEKSAEEERLLRFLEQQLARRWYSLEAFFIALGDRGIQRKDANEKDIYDLFVGELFLARVRFLSDGGAIPPQH